MKEIKWSAWLEQNEPEEEGNDEARELAEDR